MKRPSGIVWAGPVADMGGYGNVSRNFLKSLSMFNIPIHIVNFSSVDHEIGKEDLKFLQELNRPLSELGNESVLITHWTPELFSQLNYPGIVKKIGVTIFETDRIPAHWTSLCNRMDEVWLPSEFNFDTFTKSGVDVQKVRIIPYALDSRDYLKTWNKFNFPEGTKKFKFLYTCAFDYRKGIDLLIRAYCNEFSESEDVSLILKIYVPSHYKNFDIDKFLKDNIPAKESRPHIYVYTERFPREQLYSLMQSCDAYVSSDRANGWGMPCMEMMAFGIPTATINWSGSTEFMNENNSFLIEPENEFEPVHPMLQATRFELYGGHQWRVVREKTIQTVLREIYENKEKRNVIARCGQDTIIEQFSVKAIYEKISKIMYI